MKQERLQIGPAAEQVPDASSEDSCGYGDRLPQISSEYEFCRSLGRGAFGSVHHYKYRGEDVALKACLSASDLSLSREWELLQLCSHRNIIRARDLVTDSAVLVMEYAPYGTLGSYIEGAGGCRTTTLKVLTTTLRTGPRCGRLLMRLKEPLKCARADRACACEAGQGSSWSCSKPWCVARRAAILCLMVDVACGLNHLHSRPHPISHKDIKPQNILIGGDGVAKLADFGLATINSRDGPLASWSTSDGCTPEYSPPEYSWCGPCEGSTAGDMYSFGCLLCKCLAGRVPRERFPSSHMRCGPDLRDVPGGLRWLVESCLGADPASRPLAGAAIAILQQTLWLLCASGA